ncbi:MAG: lipopolysaccharide biosynthesis protein [Acidimicrobiales bacterium]
MSDAHPADFHLREIFRTGFVSFLLKVVGGALLFGFTVVLAHSLGSSGAGLFYVAYTVMLVASMIGRFGLDNAVLRFSAVSADAMDPGRTAAVYRMALRICLKWSSIFALGLLVSSGWLAENVFSNPSLVGPLRVAALGVIPTGVIVLQAQLLKGIGRTKVAVFTETTAVPLLALPLLIGARGVGLATATAACIIYVVATCVAVVVAYETIRRATPERRSTDVGFDRKLLMRTSLPLLVVSLMDLATNWSGILLLAVMRSSHDVGVFATASRTAMLLSWVLASANTISGPKFAALAAREDVEAIAHVARRTARAATLLVLPGFAVLVVAPRVILGVFGTDFKAGASALVILAVGQIVNVACGPVTTLLMMTGRERQIRNVGVVAAGCTVALQAALIPSFGIAGAAAGAAVGLATWNVLASFAVYRTLDVVPWPLRAGPV